MNRPEANLVFAQCNLSAYYTTNELRTLFIAASWDLILELPLPAGKFQIPLTTPPILYFNTLTRWILIGRRLSHSTSVRLSSNVKYTRTLSYMFKEFNIKSAIKLKTFCYVLNKFRAVDCARQTTLIFVLDSKWTNSYACFNTEIISGSIRSVNFTSQW